MYMGINDLTIRHLECNTFRNADIERVLPLVFDGLNYPGIEKDREAVARSYRNFSHLLSEYEYTLTGSVIPVDVAYYGVIVKGAISCTVRDGKRGYVYPVIVDLSNTKYEPFYNPIAYQCQLASDFLQAEGTNTDVVVLSIASGKRWVYDKRKYGDIIHAALNELVEGMERDLYPVRFGWWCAGCSYRGICHKLTKKVK